MDGKLSFIGSSMLRCLTPEGSRDQYAGQSGHLNDDAPVWRSFGGQRNRWPLGGSAVAAEIRTMKAISVTTTIETS